MRMFSDKEKEKIIEIIGANLTKGNNEITKMIEAEGIRIGYTTVRDYRHRHFPKSVRADYVASAFIKMRIKDGLNVTASLLVEKLGIKMNYAYVLARECNTKIAQKKHALQAPTQPQPVVHKSGIITRNGNVTVHRMF